MMFVNQRSASSIKPSPSEPKAMFTRLKTPLYALGLACLMTGSAFAGDTVPRVVPYDGVLDLDGNGFSGDVDLRFRLHSAAENGEVLWTETWDADAGTASVTITGGRFSVNLGTHESIEPIIASGTEVYLSLKVRLADDAGNYTTLNGRQRLNPVPFALWSSSGNDLAISGVLTTEDLSVTGVAGFSGGVAIANENLALFNADIVLNNGNIGSVGTLSAATVSATDVNATNTTTSALNVTGDLTVTNKLVMTQYFERVQATHVTNIPTDTWMCSVAGVDIDGTDSGAAGDGDIRVFTERLQGSWIIRVDHTHIAVRERNVAVICFRNNIVDDQGWFPDR